MNHPLIKDAENLSDTELYDRINDLRKKLAASYRMNKPEMVYQINLAMQTYQEVYSQRMASQLKNSSGKDIEGKIDIS